MVDKEAKLAELLAEGWREEDLRWSSPGSAVAIHLTYLAGQDGAKELEKALSEAQEGQWLIKGEALDRKIREISGRSAADLIRDISNQSFLRMVFGARPAKW
jgi:hypothetical protein